MSISSDWNFVNRSQIETGLSQIHQSSSITKIEIFKNTDLLCAFELCGVPDIYTVKTSNPPEPGKQNTESVLRMVGLRDMIFSMPDPAKPFSFTNSSRLEGIEAGWLRKITEKHILVPDTNAILNNVFSSLTTILGVDYLNEIDVMIPRLVILEMEGKANCSKDLDKRKVFLGYSEILFLKEHGAKLFPELDPNLLASFPTISGERNSDSWIRREIKDYQKSRIQGGDKKCVLFTSDLVNSLSALVENINSIYLSPSRTEIFFNANLHLIAIFLVKLSILSEDIRVSFNGKNWEIKGFWSGITTSDLIAGTVMIRQSN